MRLASASIRSISIQGVNQMSEFGENWYPDRRTVMWCTSVLHENDIVDAICKQVQWTTGTDDQSKEYWLVVATAAVEAVVYDLGRQAKEWGTPFAPEDEKS